MTKIADSTVARRMPVEQFENIEHWINETFRDHDSGMIVGRESWALACMDLIAHIYYLEDMVRLNKQKSLGATFVNSDHPDFPTSKLWKDTP